MVLKKGFTLTELLIVMAILLIMAVIIIGLINPIALVDKGYDARRKKDIKRIGVAMEEYYNDKGCYPTQLMVDGLTCGSNGFSPWLVNWPCDPGGERYEIKTEEPSVTDCPNEYRVYAKLRSLSDKDIPSEILNQVVPVYYRDVLLGEGGYTYGVSSTNTYWYQQQLDESCTFYPDDHASDSCFSRPGDDQERCNRSFFPSGDEGCVGINCFARNDCDDICQVGCCGAGCN